MVNAMTENELSEKLSTFLTQSNNYKTMVPAHVRKRFHKLSSFFAHVATAGIVGVSFGVGATALAVVAGGLPVLVATLVFCVTTLLSAALTQKAGQAFQYAFGQFDPNSPERQNHIQQTLDLITELRNTQLSSTAQKNLQTVVSLLNDKDLPPSFWSETNRILTDTHRWYTCNPHGVEQSQKFDNHVSEFQKQFNLQPQPQNLISVAPTQPSENTPSPSPPSIMKL